MEERLYRPNPSSPYRVKIDFRVSFTNGGFLEGKDFLLDLTGDMVTESELQTMIVESMNLVRAGEVIITRKQVVRRGEHDDA